MFRYCGIGILVFVIVFIATLGGITTESSKTDEAINGAKEVEIMPDSSDNKNTVESVVDEPIKNNDEKSNDQSIQESIPEANNSNNDVSNNKPDNNLSSNNTNETDNTVSTPSISEEPTVTCVERKFLFNWFRADFNDEATCIAVGEKLQQNYKGYTYSCDNQKDDCGITYYMLDLTDPNGVVYDYHNLNY